MDKKKQVMLIAALLLISCSLRAPITGVGPMIGLIQQDTGLANSAAGMLTTIPLLAFAVVSFFVGKASSRFGAGRVMFCGLAVTGAGILCRSYAGIGGLFLGTVIIGIGIAVGNVLIPAFIKAYLPGKEGIMTGVYTSLMSIFAGIAGAISVPLAAAGGWKNALSVWIFLLAVVLLVWIPSKDCVLDGSSLGEKGASGGGEGSGREKAPLGTGGSFGRAAASGSGELRTGGLRALMKSPMTWWVSLYMGVQSFLFYCFAAWLASIVQAKGFDAETAGYFSSIYMLVEIPGSLILPIAAGGRKNQSGLAAGMGILYIGGMIAMLVSQNTFTLIGAILCCGFCAGASLSFAMLLFSRHTKNAADASALSGLAQSVGYTLAAIGPACMGRLYDISGSWTMPLLVLLAMTAVLAVLGLITGKEGKAGT